MGSAVSLTISKKIPEKIKKMVLITPFSWIEGERFKDNYLFKLLVGGVRIRERLFPNKNPQSKFSYLKKSKALRNEFTDWAWNNLHQAKNDFIYGLSNEIENITRKFKLGNKKQEDNLIDELKITCRKFSKEKTGKKPFTNINLVKI